MGRMNEPEFAPRPGSATVLFARRYGCGGPPAGWLACGRGSVGRASPCQGEGRGFESRRPLGDAEHRRGPAHGSRVPWQVLRRRPLRSLGRGTSVAEWPSGLGKGLQSPVHGFDSRLRLSILTGYRHGLPEAFLPGQASLRRSGRLTLGRSGRCRQLLARKTAPAPRPPERDAGLTKRTGEIPGGVFDRGPGPAPRSAHQARDPANAGVAQKGSS